MKGLGIPHYCPFCGLENLDLTELEDDAVNGRWDYYCTDCGTSGDIDRDKQLTKVVSNV